MGGKPHVFQPCHRHRAEVASEGAEWRPDRALQATLSSETLCRNLVPTLALQKRLCAYREIKKLLWGKLMKTKLLCNEFIHLD